MNAPLYPRSFADLTGWARTHGITPAEARVRFAQYAVLLTVTESPPLSGILVFKGGNALDFVWQPNRSTQDLDFSVAQQEDDLIVNETTLRAWLQTSAAGIEARIGVRLAPQRIRQNPPGTGRTFITYEVTMGYAMPDQRPLLARMALGRPSPHTTALDINLNEIVCADTPVAIGGSRPLRVCAIEDIVAEKLRSLLQQAVRNRGRRQDLLDIAVALQRQPDIDRTQVAAFLQAKAAARDIAVSRAAFHAPDLVDRARRDYDLLAGTIRSIFIPFDEALALVLAFTDALALPNE